MPLGAKAAIIHESASPGPTGQTSGFPAEATQWLGSRFSLSEAFNVTQIGGHLFGTGGTIFGAIIALASPGATPAKQADVLSSVIASTTFSPPTPSADVRTPLSVTLPAGDYALVFGSGALTASGFALMPDNNTDLPGASYFICDAPDRCANGGFLSNLRFVVEGTVVPLPAALPLLATALAALGLLGWRRRQAA
jgi:hypothetical protein